MTSKFLTTVAAAAGFAAAALALPAPATAQDKVTEIIVYGSDPCPRSTEDSVVVCARRPEGDRYRIPERYRSGGARQSRESWVARAKTLETVGNTGTQSCSAVGPGGHTGCLEQLIRQARRERQEAARGQTPTVPE